MTMTTTTTTSRRSSSRSRTIITVAALALVVVVATTIAVVLQQSPSSSNDHHMEKRHLQLNLDEYNQQYRGPPQQGQAVQEVKQEEDELEEEEHEDEEEKEEEIEEYEEADEETESLDEIVAQVAAAVDAEEHEEEHEELEEENEKVLQQDFEFAEQTGQREKEAYDMAKKHYLVSTPEGYRKHPSYYSDTYMRRSLGETTFAQKQQLAQQWGAWTLTDDKLDTRPTNPFLNHGKLNHDWTLAKFPPNAWQTDSEYLSKFLPQGLDLCQRAMEAILAEYGLDEKSVAQRNGGVATQEELSFEARSRSFAITLFDAETEKIPRGDKQPLQQAGWMPTQTHASLKRRLLHSIMTQGTFTLATVGHGAPAAQGNHFQQSYTLQYGRILEPILARLGVMAQARNLGIAGLGTLQSALGAHDLVGHDVDVLIWDSKNTDGHYANVGIFATQSLLSGRSPILWFMEDVPQVMNVLISSEKCKGHIARLGNGLAVLEATRSSSGIPETKEEADAQEPWSTRYMECGKSIARDYCKQQRYNGTCWIDRTNFVWDGDLEMGSFTPPMRQRTEPTGGSRYNPGYRRHALQGRVLAFSILRALHEALSEWMAQPDYILTDDMWHVTDHYADINHAMSQSDATDQWCLTQNLPLAFCRVSMHARTEHTPRHLPWQTSLRSIISAAGVVPATAPNLYDPPDVYNPYVQHYDTDATAVDILAIVENGVDFEPNMARIKNVRQLVRAHKHTVGAANKALHQGQSLYNPEIQGGHGWELLSVGSDNCDGAYDSFCNRGPTNDCMLAGHNDGKHALLFDGYSGWMVFTLHLDRKDRPLSQEGVIVLAMRDQRRTRLGVTEGWCSENNSRPDDCPPQRHLSSETAGTSGIRSNTRTNDNDTERRQLKNTPPLPYCPEFRFEFAINGKITSWNLTEFQERRLQIQRTLDLWTLAAGPSDMPPTNSDSDSNNITIEVAIRTTGCGRDKVLELTHLYWA